MTREINLRQIEAFKAVMENGTISRASAIFNISQPAMSKLIAHLEFDSGLRLFDRIKGRLAPTEHGLRLYEEIEKIFAGVRQVENAVDVIRREDQGVLTIGVLPALSGVFAQQVTMSFLAENPRVFCSVQSRSSERIVEWVTRRKLDIGIVGTGHANPLVETELFMEKPLVCILPLDHPLAAKEKIHPSDLVDVPYVSLNPDSHDAKLTASMLATHGVRLNVVLFAGIAQTVCEFVSAGLGVSLIHPLMASGWENRVVMRQFEPALRQEFRILRSRDSRNARLVQAFMDKMRETAETIYVSLSERLR